MIRSMTAYASAEAPSPLGHLTAEMRAVNHRFLELGLRLPEDFRAQESMIRELVGARVSRGKVDLSVRIKGAAGALDVDAEALARLSALASKLDASFPKLSVDFTRLLEFPGVLKGAGVDADALALAVSALVTRLVDDFIAAREREGGKLAFGMRERLDAIERVTAEIRAALPDIRSAQRVRLEARIAEYSSALDPARLEQELVMQLAKLDVDEELDRLGVHVGEMRRVLARGEPAGRRLDFLLQEFNREANTLGSKSIDSRTSAASIELKVLIEQLREQVQNLE